jgi:hypothetical protein
MSLQFSFGFTKFGGLWRLILGGIKEDYQKSFLLDSGLAGVTSEMQIVEVSFVMYHFSLIFFLTSFTIKKTIHSGRGS